ncbi:hypothetical protein JOF56_011398 [Kibdelosporangium banguiense]|uniref:DUF397 domain-containing protein n=1 Tax=Kibdelosporangium banguiense TaxID=1365924 RepID=A0ABS4U480_9PSEU|nr:DUF397 domain-containing protein [Kibdelosporangium banguiense]MBP2331013.1 hypothetical protein [Kibdelosporangium banguiense]
MIHNWRKASYSVDNSSCVETGWADDMVGYRDTKQASLSDTERPTLLFSKDAAHAFITMLKSTIG